MINCTMALDVYQGVRRVIDHVSKERRRLIVFFTESRILNEGTIQQIGEELEQIADRAERGKLLLNFSDVRFMSSAMLGKLIKLNKKCKSDGVHLKLCEISKDIMEVFKLMRLNKILDIQADETRAMIAFEKI